MEYCLYFLDLADCINEFVAFESVGDETAIVMAERYAGDRPVELWNGDRLVLRKVPNSAPPGLRYNTTRPRRRCR